MSKYKAVRSGGYDSKREHRRAEELKALERMGEISDLKFQVSYELVPKQDGERSVKIVVDFTYTDRVNGFVAEDSKGVRTPAYIIKRKLLKYIHGITLLES